MPSIRPRGSPARLRLKPATAADAAAIAELHAAVAEHLTARYGRGPWSRGGTDRGVLLAMKRGVVYMARRGKRIIATLTLTKRKPWAINASCFTPCRNPLYLVGMAVAPTSQRRGLGRRCMNEAKRLARTWPGDAIRLDAFDAVAGAGGFYRKCGLREVGHATYRNTPLIYFEMML